MLYNGVGWVDKPNVSDGLWACWVFNPTYPLCHFFMHSTILCLYGMRGRLKALAAAYSGEKCHTSQTACCGCARVPKYCQRICGLAQSGHTQASAQPPHKPAKPCQPLWPPMCNFAYPPCRYTPACGKSAGKSSPAALIKASLVHHKR